MVREIAVFRTLEGQAEAFAEVFAEAYGGVANILTDAEGSGGASLYRGVEDPDSFTLMVEWDSVEAHTALAQKPEFGSFGEAMGPHLAGQPDMRHVKVVG